MKRISSLLLVVMFLVGSLGAGPAPAQAEPPVPEAPSAASAPAAPAAPTDVPTTLVSSGVGDYTLTSPKLFWHTPVNVCPPADAAGPAGPASYYPSWESITRIPSTGGLHRLLYNSYNDCNAGVVRSNIVADANYVYWLATDGLKRLSTDANVGDAPQLVNSLLQAKYGYYSYLAIASDRIYALYYSPVGGTTFYLGYVLKSNNQLVMLTSVSAGSGDLQTDGTYVYYVNGTNLYRVTPGVNNGILVSTGVTGYYPEGQHLSFCTISPFHCYYTDQIYVAKGRYIYIYNNSTSTLAASASYTSIDTSAVIYSVTGDYSRLYFAEARLNACPTEPCFTTYTSVLERTTRSGASPNPLYTYSSGLTMQGLAHLSADGSFVFWQEASMVKMLPGDANAMPQVNMWPTGMEVTQGIQNTSNSVLLIKNRRTFVRLYVQSNATPVAGVTAYLYNAGLPYSSPLVPINSTGTMLTVRPSPSRNDINQSFLFELPWSWIQGSSLSLRAVVNPNKVPLEPNYADNEWTATVSFQNSPSLSVEFFRLNYPMGGTTYSPRYSQDILPTYSWILRAYPLAGQVGENFKPRLWDVDGGTRLANWVNTSDPNCASVYGGPNDDISLCASYYTNGWLYYYRVATTLGVLNVGLNTNSFYYGLISDAAGYFPRGQAMYDKTSVGPAGTPGLGSGWDFDGTYADWYAAHEIGHSLGRGHPKAGSDDPATSGVYENCGHSRSDLSYPYGNTTTSRAPIGPDGGSIEGFDRGDASLGIAKAVLPSSTWNDVMSYCSNQWISDYTYTGMYNYMLAHPSDLPPADAQGGGGYVGDYLVLAGEINPSAPSAGFSLVRRETNVTDLPVGSGAYSIRLLNASDGVLATSAINTQANETGRLAFGHVMAFAAGTRKIQLIRNSDSLVLATQLVSTNAPVVSNVALQGAPSPVTGVVTLNWNASDADGDPLTYDVYYSRNGGTSFQPLSLGLTATTTQIDTSKLGGSGTAILKVTASDGVNTGSANSAAFTMANHPPQVAILSPENNLHIHYGQLVNFSGVATDPQDSYVTGAGLVWKNGAQTLGTGTLVSSDTLPVGTNTITLTATDSVGQQASTTVTVLVDDDLNAPGPTLTVGPTDVGWQVAAGSTTPQTAQLSIGNSGSGSLSWTAAENSSWLSLSATSGSVASDGNPATITLTADPTGLAANITYHTQVDISVAASGNIPAQKVTIPVWLTVGATHDVYMRSMFVPFMTR